MKRIIILGCTGSIGTTALQAIRSKNLPIKVVALSAHSNEKALIALGDEFHAEAICLTSSYLNEHVSTRCYSGFDGLGRMLHTLEADIVLNAISGFDGLRASLEALDAGFDLALANKESVVCAGPYLFEKARQNGCTIIPVDSEHSAIAELLKGRKREHIDSLILTASGGPFRNLEKEAFQTITVEQALAHPTWKMGKKITIDSATLANKALEVIEASHLFGFPPEKIEVVVHPQSIVHSMVRTLDGAVYAQLGNPDMTLPIINALTETSVGLVRPLDFTNLNLIFQRPDFERFPLLALAFEILERKGACALAFNAADEVAVHAFLQKKISYPKMIEVVQRTLALDWKVEIASFEQILQLDAKARQLAQSLI